MGGAKSQVLKCTSDEAPVFFKTWFSKTQDKSPKKASHSRTLQQDVEYLQGQGGVAQLQGCQTYNSTGQGHRSLTYLPSTYTSAYHKYSSLGV